MLQGLYVIMRQQKKARLLLVSILIISLLGMPLTIYLTNNHFREVKAFCDINEKLSCDIVNKSIYSEFFKSVYLNFLEEFLGFDIPVAILGFFSYIALFLLSVVALHRKEKWPLHALLAISSIGLLFSLYLTGIEAFVLFSFCSLCLISLAFLTLIFAFSIGLVALGGKEKKR